LVPGPIIISANSEGSPRSMNLRIAFRGASEGQGEEGDLVALQAGKGSILMEAEGVPPFNGRGFAQ